MNGNEKISEKTRLKVLKAAGELMYIPNALAQGLTMQKTKMVGVVVSDIHLPYLSRMVQNVEACLRKSGYSMLIAFSHDDDLTESGIIDGFRQRRVDGIVISPGYGASPRDNASGGGVYQSLQRSNIPLVMVTALHPRIVGNSVLCDLRHGSALIVDYLFGKGYRDLLLFAGNRDHYVTAERLAGCISAYQKADAPMDPGRFLVPCPNYDFEAGYDAMARFLTGRRPLPQAIMAANDDMAMGIIGALREKGLAVPKDVAVTGFDDVVFKSFHDSKLTTVHIPIEEMVRRAVGLLLRQIENDNNSAASVLLKPELVVRHSA